MKPLAIDLYCGLGGWTEGLIAEGYDVIGFDIEKHEYGDAKYPATLVLQNVLTLHGSQFKDAALIVGSSPCQEFSYRAMPWKRAKALPPPHLGMELFHAQFRIQREACEAAGRHIPLVVENVRGAQPWVGRSRWNFGSFHLWGDVPALMPIAKRHFKTSGHINIRDGNSHTRHLTNEQEHEAIKNNGGSWFAIAHNTTSGHSHNPRDGIANAEREREREIERESFKGAGGSWFGQNKDGHGRRTSSKSKARKAASAQIAKIPIVLSRHIARVYRP